MKEKQGAALENCLRNDSTSMRALKFLTDMAYSFGQSAAFFAFMRDLAEDADEGRRDGPLH